MVVPNGHILWFIIGLWAGIVTMGIVGGMAAKGRGNLAMTMMVIVIIATKVIFAIQFGDALIFGACGIFIVFSLYMLIFQREPRASLLISGLSIIPIGLVILTRIFP